MSTYHFLPMTEEYASLICHWEYPEPYHLYNMDGDAESISELLNGDYYYVLDSMHSLVGFICSGNSARVPGGYPIGIYNNNQYVDIGLGLRPDYTGSGKGVNFLSQGMEHLKNKCSVQNFQLVVAIFNERAIKVYERVGFIKGSRFKSKVDDQEIDFIVMNYNHCHKGGI